MVSPQVQTATSSHRIPEHSHQTAYERVLALGLGVALALVAALALMIPTATSGQTAAADGAAVVSVQTVAHGKATPRTSGSSTPVDSDSTPAG